MKRLAVVLCVLLAACGGGDDGADGGESTTTAAAGGSGSCPATDLAFTNLDTGETVELTSTAAVSLSDGAGYTAYAADFDVSPDDISLASAPVAPEGKNLVTLAVTVFNAPEDPPPVEAGTQITYTDEFGVLTFVVLHSTADETFGDNAGATGIVSISSVGDRFCAEVDYRDDQKELSGTIAADVKAL